MLTIIESPLFTRLWPDYWSEDERGEFVASLATQERLGNIPAHILRKIAEEMGHAQK
jgi:hypothetical protein